MNMQENARLALGLRALGLRDTDIVNFLLWIGTGEEQYKPGGDQPKKRPPDDFVP